MKTIDARNFGYDVSDVRHCTRPSTRPHVRTGREGLSGHEFQPSSPRELLSLLFQKALQLST